MPGYLLSLALTFGFALAAHAAPPVTKSAKSGPWSAAATWDSGKVPGAGACVLVREGHTVTYDAKSDAVIRGINVAGTFRFAADKDTVLNVGLIKVQAGDEYSEEGFDCDHATPESKGTRPAFLVGTPETPPLTTCHRCLDLARTLAVAMCGLPAPLIFRG